MFGRISKIIKKQLRSIKNNLNLLMSYNTNEGYGAIDRYTELAKKYKGK